MVQVLKKFNLIKMVLTLSIFVFIVLNSLQYYVRFDVTQAKVYTISNYSKEMLASLNDTVSINYYYTGSLKNSIPVIQAIQDLLQEYQQAGKGIVDLNMIDVSGREDELGLQQKGLQAQQVGKQTKTSSEVNLVYTGIEIKYRAQTKIIPIIVDDSLVEYELTREIKTFFSNEQNVKLAVGVLLGKTGETMQNYGYFQQKIGNPAIDSVDFSAVQVGEQIPSNIDILFIIGMSGITDQLSLYYIDQFIMRGGSVLFALDAVEVDFTTGTMSAKEVQSPLTAMLASYGMHLDTALILEENAVNQAPFSVQGFQITQPFAQWISIQPDFINQDAVMMMRLPRIDLFWASPVRLSDDVQGEILASSTQNSWLMTDQFIANPMAQYAFTPPSEAERNSYPVFVSRTGKVRSYFADGTPSVSENVVLGEPVVANNDVRMVLIGDADFFNLQLLQFMAQTGQRFGTFDLLANSIEWLSRNEQLMQLRTRKTTIAPLNAIENIQQQATQKSLSIWINIIFIPLCVLMIGLTRYFMRRKLQNIGGKYV